MISRYYKDYSYYIAEIFILQFHSVLQVFFALFNLVAFDIENKAIFVVKTEAKRRCLSHVLQRFVWPHKIPHSVACRDTDN